VGHSPIRQAPQVSKAYDRLLKKWDFFGKRTLRISSQKYSWNRRVTNFSLIDRSPPATTLNVNAHAWESDSYLTFISESSMVGLY
jgi:hypothetical protein